MTAFRLALCCLLLPGLAGALSAGQPAPPGPSPEAGDAERLAEKINRLLAERWEAAGVTPAPEAPDAKFLRRTYLDLAGTIPPVSEVREFLDDPSPDKRRRLIGRLLDGPTYASHFASVLGSAWLPDGPNANNAALRPGFEAWLRVRLEGNVGYDRLVREILSDTFVAPRQERFVFGRRAAPVGLSPAAFFQANENKPENLAGSTSRLFLGIRLECAQCHNHPFAEWTREQFWQYAAFFGGGQQIAIPGTSKTVTARFPDGTTPVSKGASPRTVLADWATAPDNPYFARAAANRIWAHFFGTGLAEPIDDFRRGDAKDALLEELARQFAARRFDLKFLIRAIVSSRAYQLTSVEPLTPAPLPRGERGKDIAPHLFARMAVKALSAEQVVASLLAATGTAESEEARNPLNPRSLRAELGALFARPVGKPTEFQTSIPQALALMNGRFVSDATGLGRSSTLGAVANAPFLDTTGRLEVLYLAALGRKPTPAESARLVRYVEIGGRSGDPNKALADVFWVLLNSSEFVLNH